MSIEEELGRSENSDENKEKEKKKNGKKRGPTTAKYVFKDDDGPYPLKWNDYGVAVGDHKDRYVAYTGALVRAKVKITIKNWNDVDQDIKEKMWTTTKTLFMCDDDKKTFVLRDCKRRWKDFKSKLTAAYFTNEEKNDEVNKPWEDYIGIDEDDRKEFKKQRLDPEFQALSEKNRSNQRKNEHPHHMGRGGYSKREEQHAKEQLKNAILSGPSSSGGVEFSTSSVRMLKPRPCYERWIDGRTDKKGEISNPKTKLVVNRIHELIEAQTNGEFVSEGSHDILTEALGTPECGGCVRGLGGKATVTSVFKRKKRSCSNEGMMTLKEVEELTIKLTQQVREQTRVEMKEVTLDILKSCGIQIPENVEVNMMSNINFDVNAPRLTNRSSCHSVDPHPHPHSDDPDPFANGFKEPKPCEMTVLNENIGYRVVAKGTLSWTEQGELVHDVPMYTGHVKVTFLEVIKGEENKPLPVPFFGHEVLGDNVVGSWAQWPRKQVRVLPTGQECNSPAPKKEDKQLAKKGSERVQKGNEVVKRGNESVKKGIDLGSAVGSYHKEKGEDDSIPPFLLSMSCILSLPKSCKELYFLYKGKDIDFTIEGDFEEDIYHYPNQERFSSSICGYALKKLLNIESLNISCIHIWLRLGLFKTRPTVLSTYLAHSISMHSTKQYIIVSFQQKSFLALFFLINYNICFPINVTYHFIC